MPTLLYSMETNIIEWLLLYKESFRNIYPPLLSCLNNPFINLFQKLMVAFYID